MSRLGMACETPLARRAADTTSTFRQASDFTDLADARIAKASQYLVWRCVRRWPRYIGARERLLLRNDAESIAAFAADDKSRGGETAKATAALGALPYKSQMTRCTTPLRFFQPHNAFESKNQILAAHFET